MEPNFGRFDAETPEDKERAYRDFIVHQRKRDKRDAVLRPIWNRR